MRHEHSDKMSNKVLLNKREATRKSDIENGRWFRDERYNKFRNKKKSDHRYFKKYNSQFRVKSY